MDFSQSETPASFGLLILALACFLVSTKQWRWYWRTLVWLAGAACIASAMIFATGFSGHFGVLRALQDVAAHAGHVGDSFLWQAFQRNQGGIARYLAPLVDLFLVLAALIGVLALAAFTPGETFERRLRPWIVGLIGAIAGGVAALLIVGIGLGGAIKQHAYLSSVEDKDVYDGDTFWLGETSLRLYGIDAPERDQQCWQDEALKACGDKAREKLFEALKDEIVSCRAIESKNNRIRESFGRPLVSCDVSSSNSSGVSAVQRCDSEGADPANCGVAALLLDAGAAVKYQTMRGNQPVTLSPNSEYAQMCMLDPKLWRQHGQLRSDFEKNEWSRLHQGQEVFGYCPKAQSSDPQLR